MILNIIFSFSLFLSTSFSTDSINRYEVGDTVMCSKWDDGDSYWKGKIVKRIKTIYQIELTDVHVESDYKRYLNPSECTGKKRLSFEDTPDHNNTLIWVAESCLD